MAYHFVQAFHDYGPRDGPVKAFVVHMAEGGGTVGFLSRRNARGVSVHYVIEYSGRIVQMLREDHASGSINPDDLRTTDGPAPYGASVRKQVMGGWDGNPNEAVITLELEGFAEDGPNGRQLIALDELIDDVRGRYPAMGLLGHRDFTSRKACPGAHVPWEDLGGHGPAGQQLAGGDMAVTAAGGNKPFTGYEVLMGDGRDFFNDGNLTDRRGEAHGNQMCPYGGPVQDGHPDARLICIPTGTGYADKKTRWTWVYARPSGPPVAVTPLPPADCSAQDSKIAQAIAVLSG